MACGHFQEVRPRATSVGETAIRKKKKNNLSVCIFSYSQSYQIIRAGKRLISINRIQNKSLCLHDICVCTVYNYFVYINYIYFKAQTHQNVPAFISGAGTFKWSGCHQHQWGRGSETVI